MSIFLKDIDDTYGAHELYVLNTNVVTFLAHDDTGEEICAEMDRTEFIKAVESELNGVFISRDVYPTVSVTNGHIVVDGSSSWPIDLANKNVEGIRADALANLALADYLETKAEADQKQVDALAQMLQEATNIKPDSGAAEGAIAVARELISSGKITVKTED